ncbi:MAG: hypothetical protein WKF57_09445 [Nakamurella sp.]
MPWLRRSRIYRTVTAAPAEAEPRLTAEERGQVTATHRDLLGQLASGPDSLWSTRALWACLEELRESVITEAAEVRVSDAWTDGPAAFCVVYCPPFQPEERVGLRRHQDDSEVQIVYGLGSSLFQSHGTDQVDERGHADLIAFGVAVAAFDIGEPLGNYADTLLRDSNGVGWWGSVDSVPPQPNR